MKQLKFIQTMIFRELRLGLQNSRISNTFKINIDISQIAT